MHIVHLKVPFKHSLRMPRDRTEMCLVTFIDKKEGYQLGFLVRKAQLSNSQDHLFFALEECLINAYNTILKQEEILWYQKARSNQVQFGDKNIHFFHGTTLVKRRNQHIIALRRLNDNWCIDQEELRGMAIDFFQHLCSISELVSDPSIIMNFTKNSKLNEA